MSAVRTGGTPAHFFRRGGVLVATFGALMACSSSNGDGRVCEQASDILSEYTDGIESTSQGDFDEVIDLMRSTSSELRELAENASGPREELYRTADALRDLSATVSARNFDAINSDDATARQAVDDLEAACS